MKYENYHIAIVIPYYKAEQEILKVVSAIPDYVNEVIIVNDASPGNFPAAEIKTGLNNKIQHYFIDNKNRIITKESIAEHLWGDHFDQSDNFDFIYNHIKNLRKKIVNSGGKDYIQSMYGMGYKFTE